MIPKDWHVSAIGDISDVKTGPFGSALHEKDYVLDGTPIITVEHLGERGVTYKNLPMVNDADKKRLSAYVVKVGDIVFSRVGSIDRNALIGEHEDGWLFSGRLLRVRVNFGSAVPKYLSYHFHSVPFKKRVVEVAVGQTMPSLNTSILKSIKVILPATEKEQTAIANALSDVDALITSLESLITKKRAIKTAAMQQLLAGKKRLPPFDKTHTGYKQTEMGEIPEDWDTSELGQLAKIQRGASPRPIDSPIWFESSSQTGWLRISDVTKAKKYLNDTIQNLSQLGIQNSRYVSSGNLVMSICATVGRPILTRKDVCIHDGFVVFNDLSIDKEYLYYILTELESSWSKHGQTGSQMNLNTGLINSTLVVIPSKLEEQKMIAGVLAEMDDDISALEKRLAKTQQLKQGMMQDLLTGKTRLV